MARTRRGDRSREVGDLKEEEGAGRGVACGKRGRRVAHGGIVKIKDPPPENAAGEQTERATEKAGSKVWVARTGASGLVEAAEGAPDTDLSPRRRVSLVYRVCEPSAARGGPEAPPASLPRGARQLETQRGGDRV